LDTALFPGPYVYKLFHGNGSNTANELIYSSPVFEALEDGDTTFIHNAINTTEYGHRYRVEIQSQSTAQTAESATAASLHLGLIPGDNSVTLNMSADVPWANYRYHIYRKDPGASDFVEVGVSTFYLYTDSNLINNERYCYRVKAIGSYYAGDVPDPLENWSQEVCATPYDQTPPCPPVLTIADDCITGVNTLSWQNVSGCADDIRAYAVYYAPTLSDSLTVIFTSTSAEDTVFIFDGNEQNDPASIAGCYAVTAIDSLNLWPDGNYYSNESAFSNVVCIDNCPEYTLPSIFSPNADQLNDLFKPFPYRYVKEIDLKIYNRWGGIVFETLDPAISWDGKNKDSGELCTDGIYYYVIRVDYIRLSGVVSESYSGNLRLQSGSTIPSSN
jgi:gliding motility-associated-like protein